jgi:hypothetical protein
VPNKYYKEKNSNVKSVMIEINKRIYMDANLKRNIEAINLLKQILNDIVYRIEIYEQNLLGV